MDEYSGEGPDYHDMDESFGNELEALEAKDEAIAAAEREMDVESGDSSPATNVDTSPSSGDIYRVKLLYSNESFLATWEGTELAQGTKIIVPTRYGKDLCQITGKVNHAIGANPSDLMKVERVADESDLAKAETNSEKEAEAFQLCREKIAAHKLDMKLVSVHYQLEEAKILFFFTAESRVDFRDLVKDLVGIFKTRIELRQIGVRDESRIVGGLGVCGRGYCCHTVSDKLKPVSIKMAKDQNLSLNSMKISGPCGRLLCCLAYEHGFYHEERRNLPPEGCRFSFQGLNWKVTEVNPVVGRLKIAGEDGRIIDVPADRFEKSDGRWRLKDDGQNVIPPTSTGNGR